MFNKFCLYFLCLLQFADVFCQFNYSSYEVLPALFTLDDYGRCLRANDNRPNNTYCIVYAEIIPNETSDLWQHIHLYSNDSKHHFQHERLFKGVCVERCRQLLQLFSQQQIEELRTGKTLDTEIGLYFKEVFETEDDYYEELLNSCLNYEFQQNYELSLRTSIAYCEHNDKPLEFDNIDYIFVVIVAMLVLLNVFSTIYDFKLKSAQPAESLVGNFYLQPRSSRTQRILTSFSIWRNYYRIVSRSKSETVNDLRFFDGFRALCVIFIIMGHISFVALSVPLYNTDFIENYFHSLESVIFLNGAAIIQIFFVISGFLLFIYFTKGKYVNEKTSTIDCIGVFVKLLIFRYLRLTPSLLFLMLFSGTLSIHLQDGPFWRLSTLQPERVFCRKFGWKNLLYINNFTMEHGCCLHTWYLAADMQLFEFYLIILILTAKFPKYRKPIYLTIFALTLAVPFCVTYFQELDANFVLRPENYRYFYFRDAETFIKSYVPSYMNLSGYFFGILCAEIYLNVKNSNVVKKYQGKFKYELAWWLLIPSIDVLIFSGTLITNADTPKPSLWLALYSALYRNLWAAISSCIIIGLIFKVGSIGRRFLRLPIFHVLGKISFQSYLWHITAIRLQHNFKQQPIFVNRLILMNSTVSSYFLTLFIAFIVCLTLEYPCGEVVNILLKANKKNRQTTDVKSQDVLTIDRKNANNVPNSENVFEIPIVKPS